MVAQGHDTAQRILEKALELFSQKGYAGTSVREICDAAEITKPTLYYFFGSKEGLYRALIGGALERFRDDLRRVVAEAGTIREKLERVAWHHFESTRANTDLTRFLFAMVHGRPTSAPETDFMGVYNEICATVSRVLDEAVLRGELTAGSSALRVMVLMGTISEALTGFVLAGRPDLDRALAHDLVETILSGWSPA